MIFKFVLDTTHSMLTLVRIILHNTLETMTTQMEYTNLNTKKLKIAYHSTH
jgi:hypothetical protein